MLGGENNNVVVDIVVVVVDVDVDVDVVVNGTIALTNEQRY
jgi:hypothetical protein